MELREKSWGSLLSWGAALAMEAGALGGVSGPGPFQTVRERTNGHAHACWGVAGPARQGCRKAPHSVPHMGTLSPHRRYVISSLELLVAEDYMIVYLNGATPRRRMPGIGWLKKCYHMIDRR